MSKAGVREDTVFASSGTRIDGFYWEPQTGSLKNIVGIYLSVRTLVGMFHNIPMKFDRSHQAAWTSQFVRQVETN